MSTSEHMQAKNLEAYAFYWSELRLVVAAIALFLGGIPPVLYFLPSSPIIYTALKLAWLVSGVAAAYLAYRWYEGDRKLFGHSDAKDTIAFFVLIVSGINLGLVPILGNIGMSISSNRLVFAVVAVLYLVAAFHLYTKRQKHGSLF